MDLIGIGSVYELLQEFGVVAEEYAYTIDRNVDYTARCFAPVIDKNYEEAIQKTVQNLLRNYKV
jgi:hypothetical protein